VGAEQGVQPLPELRVAVALLVEQGEAGGRVWDGSGSGEQLFHAAGVSGHGTASGTPTIGAKWLDPVSQNPENPVPATRPHAGFSGVVTWDCKGDVIEMGEVIRADG
jgi:hypothetical protein